MKIECPHCKQHYDVEPEIIGTEVQCQQCNNTFYAIEKRNSSLTKQQQKSLNASGKLKFCPDCEQKISKRAITCPHCGAPVGNTFGTGDAVLTAVCVLLVVGAFIVYSLEAKYITHQTYNALSAIGIVLVALLISNIQTMSKS